jgi:hypothetical protein
LPTLALQLHAFILPFSFYALKFLVALLTVESEGTGNLVKATCVEVAELV